MALDRFSLDNCRASFPKDHLPHIRDPTTQTTIHHELSLHCIIYAQPYSCQDRSVRISMPKFSTAPFNNEASHGFPYFSRKGNETALNTRPYRQFQYPILHGWERHARRSDAPRWKMRCLSECSQRFWLSLLVSLSALHGIVVENDLSMRRQDITPCQELLNVQQGLGLMTLIS